MRVFVTWVTGLAIIASLQQSAAASQDRRVVQASRNQEAPAVHALLRQGVDVNVSEPDGATALLWAAQWDDLGMADALIRAGANVNAPNDYGVTPLWMACTNGSPRMVDRLLRAGANANAALPTGETALMRASLTGQPEVVRALLTHGASVNARESAHGQTALMWATAEGHLDVVRELIERGADIGARSLTGFTPLMFAARQGDLAAMTLLIARGADINATALDGSSVLHVATVRGHADEARFLLERGANPNADGPGFTPLHWAAGTWESLTTYDYHPETGELSALAGLPVREGKLALIKALLAHGADINARLKKDPPRFGVSFASIIGGGTFLGATPFFLAAMVGDVEVMRVLLASGADPRLGTNDGTIPLMVAAGIATIEQETRIPEASHLEAVTLCLRLGADITHANNAGNTALHGAAFIGFPTIARFLVEQGAPLNVKNQNGETPTRIAKSTVRMMVVYMHPETAAVLRALGGIE